MTLKEFAERNMNQFIRVEYPSGRVTSCYGYELAQEEDIDIWSVDAEYECDYADVEVYVC